MGGRQAALPWLDQVRPAKNVGDGARSRPFDVRMQFRQSGDDLAWPHVRKSPAELENLVDHLFAGPMRNVQRSAGSIDESLHSVDIVPREPLVQLLTAHTEALGELCDRVQAGEISFNESRSFLHRTGYLPWHHTPSLPKDECHPCSQSVLSPMCPVCTVAEAGTARLRSGAEAPGPNSTRAVSRQLQITPCCPAVCVATAAPRDFGTWALAVQLSAHAVSRTDAGVTGGCYHSEVIPLKLFFWNIRGANDLSRLCA